MSEDGYCTRSMLLRYNLPVDLPGFFPSLPDFAHYKHSVQALQGRSAFNRQIYRASMKKLQPGEQMRPPFPGHEVSLLCNSTLAQQDPPSETVWSHLKVMFSLNLLCRPSYHAGLMYKETIFIKVKGKALSFKIRSTQWERVIFYRNLNWRSMISNHFLHPSR
uniref:Uncharacterized protein n=1 Tax=Micrurus spixii TaxID=129469 RepID=A0A2D4LEM9_9SAUR